MLLEGHAQRAPYTKAKLKKIFTLVFIRNPAKREGKRKTKNSD